MDQIKSPTLKLRTRTLLTFENKIENKTNGFADTTDPTSVTATTSSVLSGGIFMNPLKA